MRMGAVLPNRDLAPRGPVVREWAEAVEALGLDHISVPDHVLGVRPEAQRPGWDRDWPHPPSHRSRYTHHSPFHETFVTMGFLAAACDLELTSGVLVLPQRNTPLVAKQAAEVDVLTGGRLRLGVGVGWNAAEYGSIGAEYRNRGRRFEEQIVLLRRLWTEETVSFSGEFHDVVAAGLSPMPVQRPVPLWIGGGSFGPDGPAPRIVDRVGRLGDGWYLDSRTRPGGPAAEAIATVRRAAESAGRDPGTLGFDARVLLATTPLNEIGSLMAAWARIGATHVTLDTSDVGLESVPEHANALRQALAAARTEIGAA